MKTVGIVSYGISLPQQVVSGKTIEQLREPQRRNIYQSLGVVQKTVPQKDEDAVTLATQASLQALARVSDDIQERKRVKQNIGSLFIGSESHPYAVKPSGTVVKQVLGLSNELALADLEFACKAGTTALQICQAYIQAGMTRYGLAIGSDTAQAKKGDVLEYTAGVGAVALIVGDTASEFIVKILATTSLATNTPDFWRRSTQGYPEHAGRFSGVPGYFYHIKTMAKIIMKKTKLKPNDFSYCVFHSPNAKFPKLVAKQLGFTSQQLQPSLVVTKVGNTYSASSLLALASVLDIAKAGEKILLVSYGSGSGADAFVLETTPLLVQKRKQFRHLVTELISKMQEVSSYD